MLTLMKIEQLTPEMQKLVPGIKAQDLLNVLNLRIKNGEKFAPAAFSIRRGHIAHDVAAAYAYSYSGNFGYMLDMRKLARTGLLKPTMTAGIINALWNDVSSIRIRRGETVTVAAVPEHPVDPVVKDGIYYDVFRIWTRDSPLRSTQIVTLMTRDPQKGVQEFNIGFIKGDRYVPFSAYVGKGYGPWHDAIRELIEIGQTNRLDKRGENPVPVHSQGTDGRAKPGGSKED